MPELVDMLLDVLPEQQRSAILDATRSAFDTSTPLPNHIQSLGVWTDEPAQDLVVATLGDLDGDHWRVEKAWRLVFNQMLSHQLADTSGLAAVLE